MSKAKDQDRLKKFTKLISKFIVKSIDHILFEIDETSPVNIPCKQKQFMICRSIRVKTTYFHFHINTHLVPTFLVTLPKSRSSTEGTNFTGCLNHQTTLLEITKETIIQKKIA